MTGQVEVPWDFIDQNEPLQMAALLVVKRLHDPVVIDMRTHVMGVRVPLPVLLLALNGLYLPKRLRVLVESLLVQGTTQVHEVGPHDVLSIQADDIAREPE